MSDHSFDAELAQKVGVNAAILLKNISFWIEKNKANGRHCIDGEYWTYNSIKAFCELFPYLSSKQIHTALKILVGAGYIKTGNHNRSAYDRTTWYTLINPAKSIYSHGEIHLPKRQNGNIENGKPIPDSKPDSKPNNKTLVHSHDAGIDFELFWNIYPRRTDKTKAKAAWLRLKPDDSLLTKISSNISARISAGEWAEGRINFIPHPTTYLNNKRWEDEVISLSPKYEPVCYI